MKEIKTLRIRPYVGSCMICNLNKTLRCGVCEDCSPNVKAHVLRHGFKFWQIDKPENYWYVGK